MAWSRKLAREVVALSGERLLTLADARRYMLSIKDGRERREYWQQAAKLLLEAADGGSVEAITDQLLIALLHDGALDVSQTPSKGR